MKRGLQARRLLVSKAFIGTRNMPLELENLLRDLGNGRDTELRMWKGIPIGKIRKWANKMLGDRRVTPIKDRKRNKTFRISPAAIDRIRVLARDRQMSETDVLESLIYKAS